MCPKLCERYKATSVQPIANCGKSARARPLPWSASFPTGIGGAVAGLLPGHYRRGCLLLLQLLLHRLCAMAARLHFSCSQQPWWPLKSLAGLQYTMVQFQYFCDSLAHVLSVVLEDWVRLTCVLDWMWLACKGLRFQGAILSTLVATKWR